MVPEDRLTLLDDSGKYVEAPYPVTRLVLLHSDAGEIVCALGAENVVVGVSPTVRDKCSPKFDNFPDVGSVFSPNYEKIVELRPEVVITYSGKTGKEEELRSRVEPLEIRVLCVDAYKLELIPRDIRMLGLLLGKEERPKSTPGSLSTG